MYYDHIVENIMESLVLNYDINFRNSGQSHFHNVIQLRNSIEDYKLNDKGMSDSCDKR